MTRMRVWFLLGLIWLGTVATAQDKALPPLINADTTTEKNLKVFDALWEKVNAHYFDPNFNGADWVKLKAVYRPQAAQAPTKQALRSVLERMTKELKTSHITIFFTVKRKALEQKVARNIDYRRDRIFLTTGFDWLEIAGQHIVTRVYENTAAAAAGILPGWVVMQYDDKPPSAALPDELYEGMKVRCRLLDPERREHPLTLQYGWVVQRPQHQVELLNQDVGYIKLDGFTLGSEKLVQQAIKQFHSTKALIFDLRGNIGGFEYALRSSLEYLFPESIEYGTMIERSGKLRQEKIRGRAAKAYAGKLIVLTDRQTGSCAEIFAALIQENKRGQIVGRTTAGAVLFGQSYGLPEGFLLTLAFRDYLTPRGRRLEGKGVNPDVLVTLTIDDVRRRRDPDLERALELLR